MRFFILDRQTSFVFPVFVFAKAPTPSLSFAYRRLHLCNQRQAKVHLISIWGTFSLWPTLSERQRGEKWWYHIRWAERAEKRNKCKTFLGTDREKVWKCYSVKFPRSWCWPSPLTKPASRQSYCFCLSVSFRQGVRKVRAGESGDEAVAVQREASALLFHLQRSRECDHALEAAKERRNRTETQTGKCNYRVCWSWKNVWLHASLVCKEHLMYSKEKNNTLRLCKHKN